MKKKKYIFVAVILIGVFMITGISYAVWQLTKTQEGINALNSTCFKIEFESHDDISLLNAHPIKDEEGMKLTPYTFTIRNICNTNATYQINLEELETTLKRLPNQYIKVSLNEGQGKLLNSFESVEKTISNADQAFKLTTGVLKESEEKTFTLRLWMDYDTPAKEEVMEATFEGKVSIIAVQKNTIPEVSIAAREYLDGITVDVSTVKNEKNEPLNYYYQLNNESEIESEESTYTFTGLPDGKYVAKGRAETLDGIILEENVSEVTIAYEKVYISSTGNDETGSGSKESPYASLNPAYQKVKSGGEMILLSDITATETANMNIENKEVTIRSEGENIYTILKDPSFTTQILDITNSNIVTTTNIIFDGNHISSTAALLVSNNSTVNLNSGTIIENSTTSSNGGGIECLNGILNINGAVIKNNSANARGGGIRAAMANVTLNSGLIESNSTNLSNSYELSGHGGGIFVWSGNFVMNGGKIRNNSAGFGGGIFFGSYSSGTYLLELNGGIIEENSSTASGGGIYLRRDNSNPIIYGYLRNDVQIINNTAPSGSNIYTYNGAQIIDQR